MPRHISITVRDDPVLTIYRLAANAQFDFDAEPRWPPLPLDAGEPIAQASASGAVVKIVIDSTDKPRRERILAALRILWQEVRS